MKALELVAWIVLLVAVVYFTGHVIKAGITFL